MAAHRTTPPAGMSRRTFLRTSGLVGLGALAAPSFLTACGGQESDLFFENWPAYIDEETVGLFQDEIDFAFRYTEAFNDNNEYFAKVVPALSRGNTIAADILAPTFWMASRFIFLQWAEKLPLDKIPNAANLRDDLVKPVWDPTGEYTLPWQTGIAGVAYNISATGREIRSVNDLYAPEFKGRVGMLTEMRDTVGLTLMGLGIDPSTVTTFDEAAPAFDKIEKAKNDGQIRQFTGNDYLDDLSQGNFAVCVGWSGDVVQLSKDNPDVRFVVPEEGGTSWADTMLWVKGSSATPERLAAWMDYVYDPVNAARITTYVQYITPVKGVREELVKQGEEGVALAENPLLFPDEATLARLRSFATLSPEEEQKFDARFSEITGA